MLACHRPQARLGRDLSGGAQRWGPRPIDLDIVFYEDLAVTEGETLVVPHPRWQERGFVQAPLADLHWEAPGGGGGNGGGWAPAAAAGGELAVSGSEDESEEGGAEAGAPPGRGLQRQLALAARLWQAAGGERQLGTPDLECVLPMGRLGPWPWQRRTQVGGWVARGGRGGCRGPCLGWHAGRRHGRAASGTTPPPRRSWASST